MTEEEHSFRVRLGRIRSKPSNPFRPFVSRVMEAAGKAGGRFGSEWSGPGRGGGGRGRAASLNARPAPIGRSRGAVVKARVVRQEPRRTPLSAPPSYLQRDGASREGAPGVMFDARGDQADARDFAERCEGDRHRFIVSPDDAAELSDLKAYTRDLMAQAE